MSGKIHRMMRQTAQAAAFKTANDVAPAIKAAITNEQITRDRVDTIESVIRRGFWGRWRWLLTGE